MPTTYCRFVSARISDFVRRGSRQFPANTSLTACRDLRLPVSQTPGSIALYFQPLHLGVRPTVLVLAVDAGHPPTLCLPGRSFSGNPTISPGGPLSFVGTPHSSPVRPVLAGNVAFKLMSMARWLPTWKLQNIFQLLAPIKTRTLQLSVSNLAFTGPNNSFNIKLETQVQEEFSIVEKYHRGWTYYEVG